MNQHCLYTLLLSFYLSTISRKSPELNVQSEALVLLKHCTNRLRPSYKTECSVFALQTRLLVVESVAQGMQTPLNLPNLHLRARQLQNYSTAVWSRALVKALSIIETPPLF